MKNFSLGDLAAWETVELGEVVVFDSPPGEARMLRFELLAPASIAVFLTDEEMDRRLIAGGEGLIRVRVAVIGRCEMDVSSMFDNTEVSLRRGTVPQIIPESGLPSFTTIEPKQAGPGADLRRMMHLVGLNAARRERILREELDEFRRRDADRPVEAVKADPVVEDPKPSKASGKAPADSLDG